MSKAKIQFIFDTNLFWSLFECKKAGIIEKIADIFKFNSEISYIIPKTVLRELSGKYHSKIPYLQKHLVFQEEDIPDSAIEKLIRINQLLEFDDRCFDKEEKGDLKIIQTAINHNSKDIVTTIVTNDEGIHRFLRKVIPEADVREIWIPSFMRFVSKQAVEKEVKADFEETAKMLDKNIESYRAVEERGLIPIRDFDKILISSTITREITGNYQASFDDLVIQGTCEGEIPRYLEKIGKRLNTIFSFIDLQEVDLIENELEELDNYIMELELKEREKIFYLISTYFISIYSRLASLYDRKSAFSAVVSALERTKDQFKYVKEYTDKSQLHTILTWVHLLNNSEDLARFYFKKIEDFKYYLALRVQTLMQLLSTPNSEINEKIFEQLPYDTWQDLKTTMEISSNQRLKDKINYLFNNYGKKPSYVLDARHFAIKETEIEQNSILNFLQDEFIILGISSKNKELKLRCNNNRIGEIEIRFLEQVKVKTAVKGDSIQIKNAKVNRISKSKPGSKAKATIYIEEIEEEDIEIIKKSRII